MAKNNFDSTQQSKCKTCEGCEHLHNPQGGYCYMFKEKPKVCNLNTCQQPKAQPSSEFTERIRTQSYNPKWPHTLIIRTEDRDELCDRLDESEASRKELLKALKELSKVSWMIGNRITLAGSLPQQIDQIRVRAEAAIAKAEDK